MRRRRLRVLGRHLVALVLLMLMAAVGYVGLVSVRRRAPLILPTPPGPFQVGRATFDWTDASRVDPLAARPGTPRELSVWLWYPAAPDARSRPAVYAPGPWQRLHFPAPVGLFEGLFDRVHPAARDGAPVAAGRFPVVVLEPGLGSSAPQYTVLAEDLASRGYLVVGVTPIYSANLTVLHGTPVFSTTAGNRPELGGHTE